MFNNVIYFIIVLLIFSISSAELGPPFSLPIFLAALVLCWLLFAIGCYLMFRGLLHAIERSKTMEGRHTQQYHSSVTRLSIAAIVVFVIEVYILNIKYWLNRLPLFNQSSLFQGLAALSLFFFFLCTIWFFSYPCYKALFGSPLSRRSYVVGQVRLNFPILLPWMVLSLFYDLTELSGWKALSGLFNTPWGQILFFIIFLVTLMIFMPRWIQLLWGCKPIQEDEKVLELKKFLDQHNFKYRDILRWPIFEGRMLTAGIMGMIGRYRYILLTDALLELLTVNELKAVLAHEMGHARYRHLLFYVIFFVGFIAISFGLFDIFYYLVASQPFFLKMLVKRTNNAMSPFYLAISIPMLVTLVVYFRYVMGFFMRNFERQADLYSAELMGTPVYTIDSLEKIAQWSGNSRDVPSWHHFSIRERVECLKKMSTDWSLPRRHNRFVFISFLVYLLCVGGLSYELNFSGATNRFSYGFLVKVIERNISKDPSNVAAWEALAMLYHNQGQIKKAEFAYRRVLLIQPDNSVALNNLAWILATDPHSTQKQKQEALLMAKRAVQKEKNSTYLDTLAEAYFVNGYLKLAVETAAEALKLAKDNKKYYIKQLERFRSHLRSE